MPTRFHTDGLGASNSDHAYTGRAAFNLFRENVPLEKWREEAKDHTWFVDRVTDESGGQILTAWNLVRDYLTNCGYEIKEFHESDLEHGGTSDDDYCEWCWDDGAGIWAIVGPDGYSWEPNAVMSAFFSAAADHYDPEDYELVFYPMDYPDQDGDA